MNISDFELQLNQWGQQRVPFLFIVDFEMENPQAWKASEVPPEVFYSINGFTNQEKTKSSPKQVSIKPFPISFEEYKNQFQLVKHQISIGDSYLTNLTVKTKIDLNQSVEELYFQVSAKYKICWKNKFIVFSPETFVKIDSGQIFSFPMKGTIDADIPNAEELILSDAKEMSEHVTIVDLIRNDLSRVATNVHVKKFRYIDKIKTSSKTLLQVSSEICGDLPDNYLNNLGAILVSLLPAGSISGAPKNKTLQIIREAEKEKRGYYTGVVGYFDGKNLDSGVMIRFIEQDKQNFFYRSGGGITSQSKVENEYQEVLDKIYAPIH